MSEDSRPFRQQSVNPSKVDTSPLHTQSIKRNEKQYVKNEYLHCQNNEVEDRLECIKSEALKMIDDVFDPMHSKKLASFFSKKNHDLLEGFKFDAKLVETSISQCKGHADAAMSICLNEREAYEVRKSQLRNEFEHMT